MKETIATIPLMNAFHADDECPFCYLEREAEQHAISFILALPIWRMISVPKQTPPVSAATTSR